MDKLCIRISKELQLATLCSLCRRLKSDVHFYGGDCYFTVLVPPPWNTETERFAQEQQEKIKKWSEQYPDIICYCFDTYSTLVYVL
ncbi:hypothetical protein [Lacrimispora saccharolytica]|uniref:Uncharacterized protein n=1 Tax=Lacrimispora saccharolytica (strain ATCC 35040 / DSM 2544 / NRCC 2533 / WM1) TaxID=610130 RepID=D9R7J2_LACSW|nr:hypothetical protein [Lacrimispora saccharolytica]ADL03721.1 hypothetical protein Closa_1105 [[Clostridium] saccharolyticum WM1]QRV18147.1 hypothetical protein I6K70_11250 [Lacrimispora saccharolytica]